MIHTETHTFTSATDRDLTLLSDWKGWHRSIIYLVTAPSVKPFMLGAINRVNILDHSNKPEYPVRVDVIEVLDVVPSPESLYYKSLNEMLQVWQIE